MRRKKDELSYRKKRKRIALVVLALLLLAAHFCAPSTARGAERPHGGVVVVLSGGGTKAVAHIGVLKVLEEERIPIVGIVAASGGSVFGGLYAAGYSADDLHEIVMETNIMSLLIGSGSRQRTGTGVHRPIGDGMTLYKKEFDKQFKPIGPLGVYPASSLVNFLTQATMHIRTTDFDALPIPFACVAADLETGEAAVFRDGNLPSAIRASVALPGALEPWPIDGQLYVDGGLVANLPVAIAKETFPGYPVIAVNLAGPSIAKSADSFRGVTDVISQTIDIMGVERLRRNEEMADLVLYPDVSGFRTFDDGGYDVTFVRGVEEAEARRAEITALSARALPPPPRIRTASTTTGRRVGRVAVRGVDEATARDLEKIYAGWVGEPYDAQAVHQAVSRISAREEIASVNIDTSPLAEEPGSIEILFSLEKRAPYEFAVDGYTSSLHSHRWVGATLSARDLLVPGDAANIEGRVGEGEWGALARYFTARRGRSQWGFGLNARRESHAPYDAASYHLERYGGSVARYWEAPGNRLGLGLAAEHVRTGGRRETVWGPYLYFGTDTLDDALLPTKGAAMHAQLWWNNDSIWVSRTQVTAYQPLALTGRDLHLSLELGLETGKAEHRAYRATLGDQEELFTLASHPYYGDQAVWARVALGHGFYQAWWGALRGELFAAYGMTMNDWKRARDAWETGIAITLPNPLLAGRLLFLYDDRDEFTVGFTIGSPRWWNSPLP